MKSAVYLMAAMVMFLPVFTQAQLRTLHIQWYYEDVDNISGYRIYHENILACEITNPHTTSAECSIEATDGETWFTITSFHQDGTESIPSPPFSYVFAATPRAAITAEVQEGPAPLLTTFNGAGSTGNIKTYQWDFGDGEIGSGISVNHTYLSEGMYTVRLTVIDGDNASDQQEITVLVTQPIVNNKPPTAVISASTAIGNAPLQVIFDAGSSTDSDGTIQSYYWQMGDGGTATDVKVTYIYTTPGTYHPTLTVTDNGSLTDSTSTPVVVGSPSVNNAPPTAVIMASANKGLPPLEIEFNGSGSTDTDGTIVFYQWSFGDGSMGSGEQLKHIFTDPGKYTVSLIVTDNGGKVSQPVTTSIRVVRKLLENTEIFPIINFLLQRPGDSHATEQE